VYVPRRTEVMRRTITGNEGLKPMTSDCRELLTFEKA